MWSYPPTLDFIRHVRASWRPGVKTLLANPPVITVHLFYITVLVCVFTYPASMWAFTVLLYLLSAPILHCRNGFYKDVNLRNKFLDYITEQVDILTSLLLYHITFYFGHCKFHFCCSCLCKHVLNISVLVNLIFFISAPYTCTRRCYSALEMGSFRCYTLIG